MAALRLLTCGLAIAAMGRSEDLQTWSSAEVTVIDKSRARLQLSATARARDRLSALYDSRLAGVLTVPLSNRLAVRAAYLLRSVVPISGVRDRQNRYFFGPRFTALSGPVRLDLIGWYERHTHVAAKPAFNRYKAGFDLERPRRTVSPFLSLETAILDRNLSRSRQMAGLRWRTVAGYDVELGYQFEVLNIGSAWIPRHSVRSTFRWNPFARVRRQ